MTQDEKLEALTREQTELRKMIGEGVTFDVEITHYTRKPGFWGFFRRRDKVTETKVYTIKEPTLATLDRLSLLWLQMEIDETKLGDDDYLRTARALANKEAKQLAEVVATAVLGEDYYIATFDGTTYRRKEDRKALRDLTRLFFHTLKPSELLTLAIIITNVSNLGDFVNSIRKPPPQRANQPQTKANKTLVNC